MNYFELFALPVEFSVELTGLSSTYQELQRSVHPDRYAHASAQEQLLAAQKSALVNDAYQTLKHPLLRAEYLLKLRGVDMPSEQSSFRDNHFLMRQMELRELIADIRFAEQPEQALQEANDELDQEYQQLFIGMQANINSNTDETNQQACEQLRKLKFYQKLQFELERIEDQLFDD